MSLVKMSDLCKRAQKTGTGCGSFSVYSMEALMGALRAAEELNTPIIIQLAEARFKTAPLQLMGPMMVNAAKAAKVDVAVHLDHGSSFSVIKQAIELGFTSVMYDGSLNSFEENIANTKNVKLLADACGVDVEAELGLVGRSEGGDQDYGIQYTVPEDARIFVEETGVAALAIAVGNQHGNYPVAPKLKFDIIKEVHRLIPETSLVLHGGSGISDEDFRCCIRDGIIKLNIATAILNEMVKAAEGYFQQETAQDYYGLGHRMAEGSYRAVKHHIEVFNMKESMIK